MTRNDISTANYFIDEVYSKLSRYIDMDMVMERLEAKRNWAIEDGDPKALKYDRLLNDYEKVTDIAQTFRARYEKWRYDEMVETIDETIEEIIEEDAAQAEKSENQNDDENDISKLTLDEDWGCAPQHWIDYDF